MQKLVRNTNRTASDQGRIASFTDVRPAAPTVEPAGANSIDVSAAISRRPLLAAVPVVVALLFGVPYVMRHSGREYRAEATVYVSPTYFKNLEGDREQLQITYTTLVNQQILTIRRDDILAEALKRLDRQGIHWRMEDETEAAAIARLAQQLEVKYIPDSYEVLIALDGDNRKWLAPIVNTVTNTYLDMGKLDEHAGRSTRIAALQVEQAKIGMRLQQKLDEQARLSEPLMVVNVDKAAPADDSLIAAARQAREEARRRRAEAETQISILEAASNGADKTPLTAMAEDAAANDPSLRTLMGNLLKRSLDLQARIEGLTPEHPLRQSAEKEIASINTQLTAIPQRYRQDAAGRLLAKLRGDVERARLLEGELDRQVQAATSNVQTTAKEIQQAQGLGAEVESLRKAQATLNNEIDEATMEDGVPGYLRVFSAAVTPLEPYKTNSNKVLAGLLGLAFLFGIALCLGMDLIDQRILSPLDVKRAVGFPPVGMVMERTADTAAFAEEHFCRLVNGIVRGLAVEGAKSVVLTPLKPARTPGFLVTDIGRALAARGLKAVILDANPRGLEDRIVGGATRVETLSVPTPVGTEGGGLRVTRTELRTKDLNRIPVDGPIGAMLDGLKREYDVVLIDAPPLRFSADTEFLAAITEITLVVVESGETTRRELIHGATVLGRIGSPSMGVIMNHVRLQQAGRALSRDFKEFASPSLLSTV